MKPTKTVTISCASSVLSDVNVRTMRLSTGASMVHMQSLLSVSVCDGTLPVVPVWTNLHWAAVDEK